MMKLIESTIPMTLAEFYSYNQLLRRHPVEGCARRDPGEAGPVIISWDGKPRRKILPDGQVKRIWWGRV